MGKLGTKGEFQWHAFLFTWNPEKKVVIVAAPALPGCVTQGDTKEEALAMFQDAIRGYILSLGKHDESLPTGYEAGEFKVVEIETAA